jgi:hypothetical protein
MNRTNRLMTRMLASDSIAKIVPAQPELFVSMPKADTTRAKYLEMLARRDMPTASKSAIGIIGFDLDFGQQKPGVTYIAVRKQVVSGTKNGVDYCAVIIPYWYNRGSIDFMSGETSPRFTGACRLWADYGRPGDKIGRWLESRAARVSFEDYQMEFLNRRRISDGEFKLFGRKYRGGYMPIESQACLAGRADFCEQLFMGNEPRSTPFDVENWSMMPSPESMLRIVEADFGKERFEKFWKSETDVQTAFADAFGVSLGPWLVDWIHERYTEKPGPGVGASSAALTLAIIALLGLTSLYVAKRRTL